MKTFIQFRKKEMVLTQQQQAELERLHGPGFVFIALCELEQQKQAKSTALVGNDEETTSLYESLKQYAQNEFAAVVKGLAQIDWHTLTFQTIPTVVIKLLRVLEKLAVATISTVESLLEIVSKLTEPFFEYVMTLLKNYLIPKELQNAWAALKAMGTFIARFTTLVAIPVIRFAANLFLKLVQVIFDLTNVAVRNVGNMLVHFMNAGYTAENATTTIKYQIRQLGFYLYNFSSDYLTTYAAVMNIRATNVLFLLANKLAGFIADIARKLKDSEFAQSIKDYYNDLKETHPYFKVFAETIENVLDWMQSLFDWMLWVFSKLKTLVLFAFDGLSKAFMFIMAPIFDAITQMLIQGERSVVDSNAMVSLLNELGQTPQVPEDNREGLLETAAAYENLKEHILERQQELSDENTSSDEMLQNVEDASKAMNDLFTNPNVLDVDLARRIIKSRAGLDSEEFMARVLALRTRAELEILAALSNKKPPVTDTEASTFQTTSVGNRYEGLSETDLKAELEKKLRRLQKLEQDKLKLDELVDQAVLELDLKEMMNRAKDLQISKDSRAYLKEVGRNSLTLSKQFYKTKVDERIIVVQQEIQTIRKALGIRESQIRRKALTYFASAVAVTGAGIMLWIGIKWVAPQIQLFQKLQDLWRVAQESKVIKLLETSGAVLKAPVPTYLKDSALPRVKQELSKSIQSLVPTEPTVTGAQVQEIFGSIKSILGIRNLEQSTINQYLYGTLDLPDNARRTKAWVTFTPYGWMTTTNYNRLLKLVNQEVGVVETNKLKALVDIITAQVGFGLEDAVKQYSEAYQTTQNEFMRTVRPIVDTEAWKTYAYQLYTGTDPNAGILSSVWNVFLPQLALKDIMPWNFVEQILSGQYSKLAASVVLFGSVAFGLPLTIWIATTTTASVFYIIAKSRIEPGYGWKEAGTDFLNNVVLRHIKSVKVVGETMLHAVVAIATYRLQNVKMILDISQALGPGLAILGLPGAAVIHGVSGAAAGYLQRRFQALENFTRRNPMYAGPIYTAPDAPEDPVLNYGAGQLPAGRRAGLLTGPSKGPIIEFLDEDEDEEQTGIIPLPEEFKGKKLVRRRPTKVEEVD